MAVHVGQSSDSGKLTYFMKLVQRSLSGSGLSYQYATNLAFQTLLEETFTIKQGAVKPTRHVAGYVCPKIRKVTASKHPMRGMDLCDEDASSADWVNAVDRGGLSRVSESTFMLFERMELIVHCDVQHQDDVHS